MKGSSLEVSLSGDAKNVVVMTHHSPSITPPTHPLVSLGQPSVKVRQRKENLI